MLSDPEIDVEDLLNRLGQKRVERYDDTKYRFSCPFPGHKHGDANPSAFIWSQHRSPWKWFYCHGCGEQGDLATFLSKIEDINILEARHRLREWYTPEYREEKPLTEKLHEILKFTKTVNKEETVNIDNSTLNHFGVDWELAWEASKGNREDVPAYLYYMFDRGFTVETLEEWEIGIDWEGTSMITIPYRDDEYHLVGVKGRAWWPDAKARYKVLGDKGDSTEHGFKTLNVSNYLYGAHRLVEWKNPGVNYDWIIITEGELNAMMLNQWGYAACGISGQVFTKEQARIAQKYARSFVLMFDEDEKALNAANLLLPCPTQIIPARGRDACEMKREEFIVHLHSAESAMTMQLRARMKDNINPINPS